MKRVRCAIYTRKSSEEGLEQSFNSLQAQREACEAFVCSQKSEGWIALPDLYDDGGISGGTLARPALERMLAAVDAGLIDLIVVYKVDRLTRSLADFARLVERLEARGVSFVSVTQQFNTATSMGRLTLNVLLSFAQFEREVTGERIRDKIAASKARGMWMGGLLPLGYDLGDDGLKINPAEAETVQHIFRTYLEVKSVRRLLEVMEREGIKSKLRANCIGRAAGGAPFSKGALYYLLSNPVYIGKIRHRDKLHDGLHQPIMDAELFESVQKLLGEQRVARRQRANAKALSPLAGKIFDETGGRLVPTHAAKGRVRYRYYVSQRLIGGAGSDRSAWRLPAQELEDRIFSAVLSDPAFARCRQRAGVAGEPDRGELFGAIRRVDLAPGRLVIDLDAGALLPSSAKPQERMMIEAGFDQKRRGVELRMALETEVRRPPDRTLVRSVHRAIGWVEQLKAGASITSLAEKDGVQPAFVTQRIHLGLLSPRIVGAVLTV
jgi:DNA invertase Pin-like site-specific DNA recombinase